MDELTESRSNKKILSGTMLGYISFFISIATGVFLTPYIINKIGDSNYGIYTLSNSLISLFLLDFGLTYTTNAFLVNYKAKHDEINEQHFLNIVFKLYLIIDFVILCLFVIFFFLIDFIYAGLSIGEKENLKIIYIIISCYSLISFPFTPLAGILSANEKFSTLKFTEIVHKIIYSVLCIVSLQFDFSLIGIAAANIISGTIFILIRLIYCKKVLFLKVNLFEKNKSRKTKEIIFYSFWTAVMSIFTRLIFNITPSILGIVSDSAEIAFFGVASTIEGYIYTFGSIMSGLFMPKISRILQDENWKEKIQLLAIKVGKIQFYITSLIIFGFCLCGKEFITLWIGNDSYTISYYCVLIICAYQLINIPQIIFYNVLFCLNKVKELAFISIIKACVNCVLSFVLSYFCGCLGAAIAICVSRTLELVLFNLLYRRVLTISLKDFFIVCILKPGIIPAVSLVIVFLFSPLIASLGLLLNLLIKGLIFVILFVILVLIMDKKIIEQFKSAFSK